MSGLLGQLGFKTETTYGTSVTVDTFHQGYLSGNPVREQPPLVSKGIRAGRRTPTCIAAGAKTVQGAFSFELTPRPLATLLTHMFGTVNTTGAGPYVHTATPGPVNAKSFTAQVGIAGTAGTVHPFTYKGCKISGWTLGASAGELATLGLDVVAQDYVTATALASASYGAGCPFTFAEGTVSVGGVSQSSVKSFELSAARPMRTEHFVGSSLINTPIETGQTEYRISIDTEFVDLTVHDLANTAVAVVLSFTNGVDTLAITTNAWVEPTTPTVDGVDSLNSFSFDALCYGATDAAAITAVLTNTETTAA